MLLKIVDLPEAQNSYSRKDRRYSIHQIAADAPEGGIHGVSCHRDVCLCEIRDLVFAADVTEGMTSIMKLVANMELVLF